MSHIESLETAELTSLKTFNLNTSEETRSDEMEEITLKNSPSQSQLNIEQLTSTYLPTCDSLLDSKHLSNLFKLISLIAVPSSIENNQHNKTRYESIGLDLRAPDSNSHSDLIDQIGDLRNDFSRLRFDLVLNEVKLELGHLVDQLKSTLIDEFESKLTKLSYELSILNAKLASMECKLVIRETNESNSQKEPVKRGIEILRNSKIHTN
jgi:hypothetical protein